ncbi:unnamed protein product [Amoebophrya sp. A25]|nr:unnamed protein product [Amoebophrya sp. A25]|eukprot:GSA25T00009079001.1
MGVGFGMFFPTKKPVKNFADPNLIPRVNRMIEKIGDQLTGRENNNTRRFLRLNGKSPNSKWLIWKLETLRDYWRGVKTVRIGGLSTPGNPLLLPKAWEGMAVAKQVVKFDDLPPLGNTLKEELIRKCQQEIWEGSYRHGNWTPAQWDQLANKVAAEYIRSEETKPRLDSDEEITNRLSSTLQTHAATTISTSRPALSTMRFDAMAVMQITAIVFIAALALRWCLRRRCDHRHEASNRGTALPKYGATANDCMEEC